MRADRRNIDDEGIDFDKPDHRMGIPPCFRYLRKLRGFGLDGQDQFGLPMIPSRYEMDLRQLRYFVTVAAERNFTRAADKLHIAQPPLSRQIQQLEAEVGAELIDRNERPLRLTPAGRLFHEQAVQVLGRVEEMRSMMRRAIVAKTRRFVIGFVASTIYAHLPALIREFRAAAPDVELGLVELVTLDQIAALK